MAKPPGHAARRDTAAANSIAAVARDNYSRAEYDVARTLLAAASPASTHEAGEIALLSARAAAALGKMDAAFTAASDAVRNLEPGPDRATALALRARAARLENKARDARTSRDEAARDAARFAGPSGASARYELALDAFETGDTVRAESLLRENLAAAALEPASGTLLGAVLLKRERYADAFAQFSTALRKLQSSGETDVALEARALAGLASVAVETVDMRALERIRKAFVRIPWTSALRAERFALLTSMRYASLLENDLRAAFFEAREAASVAPVPAAVALAEVHAGATSAMLGDRNAEKLHFARSWNVLSGERWRDDDDDAPLAMLTFVIEAALAMPAEARKVFAFHRALAPKVTAGGAGDRRTLAFEAMATGRLSDAAGDEISAERFYQKAFDLFGSIRYDMRVAILALDLRRISGDDRYIASIRSVLERAPKAWFGIQLAAQDGPLERLSPAELVVLAHLIRGETAKSIGEKLERSPFTISNHTRRIFQAFEVNSRSRVIAICAELNITPEYVERLAR